MANTESNTPQEQSGAVEVPGELALKLLDQSFPKDVDPAIIGAFFDVDQTLVRGATSYWAAKEMFRSSFFGVREISYAARKSMSYFLFGENQGQIAGLVDRAAQIVEGKPLEDLQRIGETIFEDHFVPRVYKRTYDILKRHIEAGHTVYLVSATPWLIAEEFARRIGAAGGIGTKTKVHDGLLVGELDGNVIHGEEKVVAVNAVAVEHNLDLDQSFAYSDSANDIPMLSMVGHPFAVNPDRALRAYAKQQGWPIIRAYERADVVKRWASHAALVAGASGAAYLIWKGGSRSRQRFASRIRSAKR